MRMRLFPDMDSTGRCPAVVRLGAAGIAVAVLLAVSGLSAGALGGELIQGGDFESGDFHSAWVHGAGNFSGSYDPAWADHDVVLDLPFAGNYSVLLGFKYTPQIRNRYAFMYQEVTIPSDVSSAVLYFMFRQQGYDGLQYDPFYAEIRDLSNNVLATVIQFAFTEWNDQFKDSGWIEDDDTAPSGYDMSAFAGQTVRIYFRQTNTIDDLYETWTFVDDVSLVYSKYVDLAVDGDGDDVFGDPGTGAGGQSLRSCQAGETVSYVLDIENEGADSDSYDLTISLPSGWSAVVNYGGSDYAFPWTTPVMTAGSKIQAEVKVTVPPGEPTGGYSSVLDAVSVTYANRFDSVSLGTNVVPAEHLTDLAIDANGFGVIDPDGGGGVSYKEVSPDTVVEYTVELLNAGTETDSFAVTFASEAPLTSVMQEGAVIHTGAFTSLPIPSGGSETYSLLVTVPAALTGGDYETLVQAHSLTDTLKKDGVLAITRVLAASVDMVIGGSGLGIVDGTGSGLGGSSTIAGTRGTTVYFPVILRNTTGVVDSFTLDWTAPGGGWSAVINDGVVDHAFPWTTPAFDPFSQRSFVLAVTIPAGAAYDTYVSILDAVSALDPGVSESVTAGITVASGNEVDLLIDGNGDEIYGPLGTGLGGSSVQTALPGDTIYFTITLQNDGGENLFDMSWTTPDGWEVVVGDSTSTMRGITAGVYTLEVRIPADSPGGTFDIIVDGFKTNKDFFVDSVRGRVFVTAPHIVDALIDGNGDEMFGAPGTGAGGFSSQSTIGGRTVRFTLELQNQGAEAESYTVSWNNLVGWTATLEGSGSPYTTGTVDPGGSALFTFEVTIPNTAAEGDYDYILDVVSTIDPGNEESVNARIHINLPPRTDLVIDGDGAFDTAPAGSGEGGRAMIFGDPGTMTTAVLEVCNRGGFPDSFRVTWSEPAGWPAGSVLLSDGTNDYTSPFVTGLIAPDSSLVFTVKVFVPAVVDLRSRFVMDGVAISRDLEDSILLEIGTSSFVLGRVFNDKDHDGVPDAGEGGWSGVSVELSDPGGPITSVTDGSGAFVFEVPGGIARELIEHTPSGMIDLSPDTVSLTALGAGDTALVYFADVPVPVLAPECDRSAPSGGFVDFPHIITAGTAGQATIYAVLPPGWMEVFYRDINEDGLLDGGDARLTSSDLDLDPDVPGRDKVAVIMRVFVPSEVPAGTVEAFELRLDQVLSGTAVTATVWVVDRILVLARASGMLRLVKNVDLDEARPGDVITYTIVFTNTGVEGVQEIEIIDPISDAVDFVLDAFGPGLDVEWVKDGASVYLTADPSDPDEAMLEVSEGRLRIVLSRQAPFVLESGAEGRIVYSVRIR